MITKTYTSRGVITFTLRIGANNKTFRFTHTPVGGGSVYTTSSKAEQEALEKHPYFGSSYVLTNVVGKEDVAPAVPVTKATTETKIKTVQVNDIEEARDYLLETYNYKASELRSRKSIIEAAAAHDLAFEGI